MLLVWCPPWGKINGYRIFHQVSPRQRWGCEAGIVSVLPLFCVRGRWKRCFRWDRFGLIVKKQWLLCLLPRSSACLMVLAAAPSPIILLPRPASSSACQEHTLRSESGLNCWWSCQCSMLLDPFYKPRGCPFSPHLWIFVSFSSFKKKGC